MDVFKAWPGRAESIVISQESYMGCTGGVAPWRRDGDTGPSYYAVCPLCDNPIQIVGLFRRQEESRARRPYGRHHRGDVPGLCRYDEDAYLHCRMRIRTIGRTPERDVIRRIRQVGPCMVSCAASSTG